MIFLSGYSTFHFDCLGDQAILTFILIYSISNLKPFLSFVYLNFNFFFSYLHFIFKSSSCSFEQKQLKASPLPALVGAILLTLINWINIKVLRPAWKSLSICHNENLIHKNILTGWRKVIIVSSYAEFP